MCFRDSRVLWVVTLAILCSAWSLFAAEGKRSQEGVGTILGASGVKGGLVVHVGCGDGRVTAGLLANDRYLVQGLDRDPRQLKAARNHLRSLGLYGDVSVRHWDSTRLPYGDNIANLIVITSEASITSGEIPRVLAPSGIVLTRRELETKSFNLVSQSLEGLPAWNKYRKPVPDRIDQWTHYLHDAGNNAVAEDQRVGPPRHLQWKSNPTWCRSHECASSVHTLVSSNGRLIGVIDEGIIGQPRGVPTFWTLIARDAFNGKLLWRRPCRFWCSMTRRRMHSRSIPSGTDTARSFSREAAIS